VSALSIFNTKEKTITHFKNGSFLKIVPRQNKTKIEVIYGSQKAAQTLIYQPFSISVSQII